MSRKNGQAISYSDKARENFDRIFRKQAITEDCFACNGHAVIFTDDGLCVVCGRDMEALRKEEANNG